MIDPREVLALLLDLTRDLTAERPLEENLRQITDAALRILPADHASVRLLDESGAELIAGARSGLGAGERPMAFRKGEGVGGWVAEAGVTARIDDVTRDERFKPGRDQGFAIGSMLSVPLWSAGRVVGVLSATSPRPTAFSHDDELMARLLANCSVPPIEKARLERLAITDHHTMAYNQRYLVPRLREELDRARHYIVPLSLMLLDLDNFKVVNDQHGHPVGDVVLRVFADRVRESVRRGDILVRRGGDEFVLIMPGSNADEAHLVAERIRRRLAERPIESPGVELRQTVSIGVATWDGSEGPAELEQRADEALYEAKRQGRDRVAMAPARTA